ncbi:hemerythrin domain-containing protein [Actinomadura sp. KC216]|uniref:hemerythrin domain-containing protein n=1 Tax=Actinomadura sp. KC216 TaxID=2530370 RepID=UPI001052AE87|nr:hemerythrin domain-containing protein [Actinomadura sp. KC216]TDB74384.1 hemerythrin domain-containing protein [Actinomadura sp. KC216]
MAQRDVIQVLTHDHREVEEMFDELSEATDPDARRRIVNDITIELVRHSVAEEMYLYPAVRELVPGGDELADKEISEHAEVERILKELERADPAHDSFGTLVRRLIDDVSAHVREEEGEMFPRLADNAGSEELLALGKQVESAKRTAPTRPHPSAPDRPPLNKLLAPGTGLIDRVRDHLTGRGRD